MKLKYKQKYKNQFFTQMGSKKKNYEENKNIEIEKWSITYSMEMRMMSEEEKGFTVKIGMNKEAVWRKMGL
jgi:hypothetical protein